MIQRRMRNCVEITLPSEENKNQLTNPSRGVATPSTPSDGSICTCCLIQQAECLELGQPGMSRAHGVADYTKCQLPRELLVHSVVSGV